jgi:uncharacterized protein (TIRG00374 family)
VLVDGVLSDIGTKESFAGVALDPRFAAAVAGFLGAARPWFGRRAQWAITTLLVLFIPAYLVAGGAQVASLLVALTAGHLAASVALLVTGTRSSRLPVEHVLRDLASRGLVVRALRLDPPGTGPFVAHATLASSASRQDLSRGGSADRAVTASLAPVASPVGVEGPDSSELETASGLLLEVLSDDDRTSDFYARLRRTLALRRPGDATPFSSLRRAVEHEALVVLAAERAGVTTPGELLVAQPADGWMMLGVPEPTTTHVTATSPDLDRVLEQLWADLLSLRRSRIAHRAVRPDALAVRADGTLVLSDFRSGELAAGDFQLDVDLAQGLYTASLLVGPERGVRSAVEWLGRDLVIRGVQGLGPVVVPRAARGRRQRSRVFIDEIREQVQKQCDVVALETYRVSRFSRRQIVQLILLIALTYVALPLLGQLPRTAEAVRTADPVWGGVALLFAALGPLAAALALQSCTTVRLPRLRTISVQIATSFVGTSTPASVGSLALNARYLTRTGGLTGGAASGVIALQNVVQVVTHLGLLALLGVAAGRSLDVSEFVPGRSVVLLVVAFVLTAAGIVLAIPRLRRTVLTQVRDRSREVLEELKGLARRPGRLAFAVVGSFGVILASAAALWACVLAFGGGSQIVAAAFVTMVGATLATAAPTPGGVGAVEAALIGGLAAFGVPSEIAVPAAFLYRLFTCWIPVFAGYFVLRRLQSENAV